MSTVDRDAKLPGTSPDKDGEGAVCCTQREEWGLHCTVHFDCIVAQE